ncbi:MAG: hypothetical protein IPH09_18615 [bacterium]|nr:hypothetical protein [bacterium]
MIRGAAALLLPVLLAAATVAAASPAGDFAAACAALPDGAPIRLQLLDGSVLEGRVAGWDGARLRLVRQDGGAADCEGSDAAALWVRERHTAGGLKHGALIGGLAGGVGAIGLIALFSAMDDDGLSGGAAGAVLLMGLGGGAGLGALVGGITGSSLPAWDLRWARPGWSAPPDWSASPDPPRAGPELRTGGLELLLGAASARDWPQQDGLAYGLRWRSALSPRWSAALEVARFRAEPAYEYPVDQSQHREDADDCRHAGALLQYGLATGDLRPYLLGGLGAYWWEESYLGYEWGCGLEGDIGRRAVGRLEFRRHDNLQRLMETDPGLVTIQIGVGRSW